MVFMSDNNLIFLESRMLQQDMRVRMPKSILSNLDLKEGESVFDIFLDKDNNSLVLKVSEKSANSRGK